MKKILFAALLMITSIAAFSQKPEQKEKPQFERRNEMRIKLHQRPQFYPNRFPMQPKPERIFVRGNKVIVIFDRKDFQKLKPMVVNRDRVIFREKPHGRLRQIIENKIQY